MNLKLKWVCWLALVVSAGALTGCVQTLDGRYKTGIPISRDRVEGRYERSPQELWTAAKDVLNHQGKLVSEDTLKSVLEANVDERRIWIKIEEFDSKITRVIVQARTKAGIADMEMAAFIDKQIAVRLTSGNLTPTAPTHR